MTKKFEEIDLFITDLLLDPNNPRFSKTKEEETPEKNYADNDIQKYAYEEMLKPSNYFEIEGLANSIKEKGFFPVDKIFVRKIKDKYLVVEGNRRISAIKFLLNKHELKIKKYELNKKQISSLQKVTCTDLTDVTENDINLILGLRHHGSIKEWRILPASFNLFKRYMKEYSKEYGINTTDNASFLLDKKIIDKVSDIFSIKPQTVKNRVQSYRVYAQLSNSNIYLDDDKFSMIFEALNKKPLRSRLEFDPNKCTFSGDGLELFTKLCIGLNGNNPILTGASAGSSTLRDYAFIVNTGQENFIKKIEEDREKAEDVKAEFKEREKERDLIHILEKIIKEIEKVKIKNISSEGLAKEEKLFIKQIEKKLLQIEKAAGEK